MNNIELEIAKETERLVLEGLDYNSALIKAKELYKKYLGTDQSNQDTKNKDFKVILPPGIDLDKGEIYDIETGETIKEL